MTREELFDLWDLSSRLTKTAFDTTFVRIDWANAAYEATMPGNIEAYIAVLTGCR